MPRLKRSVLKFHLGPSPFHCQYSVMKNKTISHNWLALLYARTDTGSPITEYPETGKKTRLVCHGRFTRKTEISTTMPYVRVFQIWSRCLGPQNLRKIASLFQDILRKFHAVKSRSSTFKSSSTKVISTQGW